ncbi:MAG: hypothetical protein WCJ72_14795 [Chryseobacterium sp.]
MQNTILGYSSGCRLGANSTNNVIIGAQSAFGNAVLQNKLYIHSSQSTPTAIVSDALISGDFIDRYVNINGVFSVTPGKMPSADSSYTKNIVAKPDGTFGWENKVEYIALTGTEDTKPVTGDIFIKNNSSYTMLSPRYVFCADNTDSGSLMESSGLRFLESSSDITTITKTGLTSKNLNYIIDCYESGARGLTGARNYTKNIQDFDYVQKIYVDKKHSYSTNEEKTGGTWINGKPIYKKTVVFDTIPSNGEIDITTDFPDIEVIVANQMFTEWWAMDIAFAGNQWKTEAFISLQTDMVKIQLIKSPDYNYSLVNSFTLTLEYTKKLD